MQNQFQPSKSPHFALTLQTTTCPSSNTDSTTTTPAISHANPKTSRRTPMSRNLKILMRPRSLHPCKCLRNRLPLCLVNLLRVRLLTSEPAHSHHQRRQTPLLSSPDRAMAWTSNHSLRRAEIKLNWLNQWLHLHLPSQTQLNQAGVNANTILTTQRVGCRTK